MKDRSASTALSYYSAPTWLPGGHLQTIYAYALRQTMNFTYRRERWETPDGDFIDLDWLDPSTPAPAFAGGSRSGFRPTGVVEGATGLPVGLHPSTESSSLVVLFHGMEGSSRSHYAICLMNELKGRGMRGVVVHLRGCSGEVNRLARAYHSGDSSEIDWILRRLKQREPKSRLYTVGVSIGGNMLLKWLGEQGENASGVVDGAAAISVPVDLTIAAQRLDCDWSKLIYTSRFLRSMKPKLLAKISTHDLPIDTGAVRATSTFREIDDLYTAPFHGFKDAPDYWQRSSSKPWLRRIRVPTLMINARNDPFFPGDALPTPAEVSDRVALEFSQTGGHVGFVTGKFPGDLSWLPSRILRFFAQAVE
ncbi:MAG TPA: alpha/beta fold hydrolase [Candidatus Binatia bacterium]|nr:alpha/beta fold hydrolase [Candidatus Binatia bacterium]